MFRILPRLPSKAMTLESPPRGHPPKQRYCLRSCSLIGSRTTTSTTNLWLLNLPQRPPTPAKMLPTKLFVNGLKSMATASRNTALKKTRKGLFGGVMSNMIDLGSTTLSTLVGPREVRVQQIVLLRLSLCGISEMASPGELRLLILNTTMTKVGIQRYTYAIGRETGRTCLVALRLSL